MGLKQMTMVFDDQSLTTSEFAILISIADAANESGIAWPSLRSITLKSKLSMRTVERLIKSLEERGYIFKVKRQRKNGSNTSNKYLIYPGVHRKSMDEEEFEIFSHLFPSLATNENTPPVTTPGGVDPVTTPGAPPVTTPGAAPVTTPGLEPKVEPKDMNHHLYVEIIKDLNDKVGSRFSVKSSKTKKLITARLNEGFTINDFFYVHSVKCNDWLGDDRMFQYLRPETLYSNKFEGYLNSNRNVGKSKTTSTSASATSDFIKGMYSGSDSEIFIEAEVE